MSDIDSAVAEKVMGWSQPEGKVYWVDSDGHPVGRLVPIWKPSERIDDAWEVLSTLPTHLQIEVIRHPDGLWRCDIYNVSRHGFDGRRTADTAPLAICKAALEAVNN